MILGTSLMYTWWWECSNVQMRYHHHVIHVFIWLICDLEWLVCICIWVLYGECDVRRCENVGWERRGEERWEEVRTNLIDEWCTARHLSSSLPLSPLLSPFTCHFMILRKYIESLKGWESDPFNKNIIKNNLHVRNTYNQNTFYTIYWNIGG